MSTRRALAFSFLDRYAALVLSIASSMVIARLLTPADIGVFSVTMVMVAFAATLRDLGAGQYLVQERELTLERLRATWALMLCTGTVMAAVVLALALPVSWFYREPRMAWIMVVVSLTFLANPFGSLTYGCLMRDMRFETLARMRFSSSLSGAVTSVLLAWQDFGPMSLALGNLAATAMTALLGAWFRPAHIGWRPEWREIRRVLRFGGTISSTSLAWDLANGAPELLLGRLQSLTAAGYFSRANGLTLMFQRLVLDATQSVALPLFAREQRSKGTITASFLRASSYVTALGWSFLLGLAVMAPAAVRLLYGDQWDASVDLVRVMALGMCVALPAAMCQQALMALERVSTIMRVTLFLVPLQVGFIALGASHSALGASVGFAAAQGVAVLMWVSVTRSSVGCTWRSLLGELTKSAMLAALVMLAPLTCLAVARTQTVSPLAQLAASALLGVVLFVAGARVLRHPINAEVEPILRRLPWSHKPE